MDVAVVLEHVARAVTPGGDADDLADASAGYFGLQTAIGLREPEDVRRDQGR